MDVPSVGSETGAARGEIPVYLSVVLYVRSTMSSMLVTKVKLTGALEAKNLEVKS